MRCRFCYCVAVVCCILFLGACHSTEPSPEHDGTGIENNGDADGEHDGADGERPGGGGSVGPGVDYTPELGDATARYSGPGLVLRHDRPGVLVKTFVSGRRVEFYDLDGNDRVKISWGGWGLNDSLARQTSMEVNGEPIALKSLKLMAEDRHTSWMLAIDQSDGSHVIVIPR